MQNSEFNTNMEVQKHSLATETLIVISQSMLFVLLFYILKIGLIDKRGMLAHKDALDENIFQVIAILFAIITFIILSMLTMHTYEYASYVAVTSFTFVFGIIGYDFRKAYATIQRPIQNKIIVKKQATPKLVTSVAHDSTGFDF